MGRIWYFVQTVLGIIFRHPVLGTSIIPVLPDGQIVLIRRRDNGKWGLPGGMVDWGQDIPTTVRRELAEETGLELLAIRRLVGIYSAADRDPRVHSVCVVVEAEVQGTMQIHDEWEITAVQAFERSAIPMGNLSHDHGRQLQDYFDGKTTVA
ncbi:NUDIX hydrolase [Coleofasciculus sp. E2-BRE-01]|jgi:ADP-ribose pyrophosphatase YjhB (NUDIX family)|uniref:NUDIX hydrolase n=1 Tax=unclassified Coleofasciculus TaxID=2692782 RepID=UPI0033038DAE